MIDAVTKKFTNDTLEEELRRQLVDKNNECNELKAKIQLLEKAVADEQEQKYKALVRVSELVNINKLDTAK
tara:strand:+ start:644 stop:856 length:213 start_codon:yes stop_codon:yes gene_type:complete